MTGRIQVRGLRAPTGDEPANREMLITATDAAIRPDWVLDADGQPGWMGYRMIYRQHLTLMAEAIAIRDGQVQIEMHYSLPEQCDRRCQAATGDDCTCSCEGRRHGEALHAAWV